MSGSSWAVRRINEYDPVVLSGSLYIISQGIRVGQHPQIEGCKSRRWNWMWVGTRTVWSVVLFTYLAVLDHDLSPNTRRRLQGPRNPRIQGYNPSSASTNRRHRAETPRWYRVRTLTHGDLIYAPPSAFKTSPS